jgi:hypothetical protein
VRDVLSIIGAAVLLIAGYIALSVAVVELMNKAFL